MGRTGQHLNWAGVLMARAKSTSAKRRAAIARNAALSHWNGK